MRNRTRLREDGMKAVANHMATSFDTLRTWNGEQSRAFEELAFQLLKESVPLAGRAIRTGNPDGGVEWYATLKDGSEWGWQAKHVHGIDALLTAMTASVERVAKERPNLRRLTFVISWNLATGKAGRGGRERKSQREKYEDKVVTWQQTVAGANLIQFDLVQGSDLLDELAKPQHAGRRYFWWGELVFGAQWLASRHQEQSAAAGEKYRPDLQVDVPIQEDLLALGFDQSVCVAFDRMLLDVRSGLAEVRPWSKNEGAATVGFYEAVQVAANSLSATAEALSLQAGDASSALAPLVAGLEACRSAIRSAAEHEGELQAAWRDLSVDDPKRLESPPEWTNSYHFRILTVAVDTLLEWLGSTVGRSFRGRVYFLTGEAGSGKTHLLLDATRRALDSGRAAVFLTAAQFGRGNLWASVADQLGLEPVGAEVLLSAMDAAGEAASVRGSRFVIFIDALNETTPSDFWRVNLPMLRATVAAYPHVAIAVSCRDTYVDLVLEGSEGSHYIRRSHPGFAEREIEATQRYFAHYKLEAPRIPLLTPEFTLPLFLRLYCESLSQEDRRPAPDGHQGRVAIFERYLAAKLATVARRYRPSATSAYELGAATVQVRTVVDALLDELSRLGRESMSVTNAEQVAQGSLGPAGVDVTRVLGLLQEEGVLTRERLYLGDGEIGEGIRIVFQAFSDFLLLKRRLSLSEDPLRDAAVNSWLTTDCSWGVLEAATIVFPELHGVEVPDLLGIELADAPSELEKDGWERHHRALQLYRSLAKSLPYRRSDSISPRTIDLLNQAQACLTREEFYQVLFMLAPLPGSRLNGDRLHRYLTRRRMPQRDRDFGFATYHALSDASSPAARLARWAAAGPYLSYDPEVIELACIPLCWLLSSPNRFMRDWVTKALVQLLRGHLDVMRTLFERFWTVDDPYVVQRMNQIAYGALLRSAPAQADQAGELAGVVLELVFARPVRPDELLLDAARNTVRWAVAHGMLPDSALESSQRPYGLKLPGPPPTEATIDARYGWQEEQPEQESYSSIRLSLLRMGDFGRYVVESGLSNFSRHRIGHEYPKQELGRPRFNKSRWQKFVATLSEDQKLSLGDTLLDPEQGVLGRLSMLQYRGGGEFTHEQRALLDDLYVRPKPVNDDYPTAGARRWVFRRTLSLGWTPKLFGHQDGIIGRGRGREGHKSERWGKKYQWMAYHELLARVADNYQASRRLGDSEQYDGLHQIIGGRDIDPSLPPIDFRALNESDGTGSSAWESPPFKLANWPPTPIAFSRYRGDIERFLSDTSSEPTIATSAFVRDQLGNDWVVLESYVDRIDPAAPKGWRGLREQCTVHTLLIGDSDAGAFLASLRAESRHEILDLVDTHGHTDCCYVGEIGRVAPNCYHRHALLRQETIGDRIVAVAPTVEKYAWEGNILDCSIGETASLILPSTFMQQAAMLNFDMAGPSWLNMDGEPTFTFYTEEGTDSRALLVRAAFLQEFLKKHGLSLILLHWFERMELKDDYTDSNPYIESETAACLSSTLSIVEGAPRRTERNLN